jgi:hypothetical protein
MAESIVCLFEMVEVSRGATSLWIAPPHPLGLW